MSDLSSNKPSSTKPYMVRAIHEWCMDNNFTPHLLVSVNAQTRVPIAYVKNGEIVLNLSYSATKDLHIDNDTVVFSARFGGQSQHLFVPMSAVKGIFARESGQGMFFEIDQDSVHDTSTALVEETSELQESKREKPLSKNKPTLTIVK